MATGSFSTGSLYRIAAFTAAPNGGNPAGVWIGDHLPTEAEMQRVATEVGFSETAFVAPSKGSERVVRYFSPEAEVSFCGHATIATGIVLGNTAGNGTYQLQTSVGIVPVAVRSGDRTREASLTSVLPEHCAADASLVAEALDALRWRAEDLDAAIPPVRAYAGAWHLVLAVRTAERLAQLDYDFDALKALMLRAQLTTLQLIWREKEDLFESRNPFPVGGVVEDPATGAAAAALGGYLRDAGLVKTPSTIRIRQGATMGRPSHIVVDIPESGGIVVTGEGVPIPE
ncbi:MAG: PhzF family phenazine biosynthesis protein [Gemmatimonadota bacterium]|nr:PhzF family phenazine biosynthesis protein [Gemmatimonadota bacterium]